MDRVITDNMMGAIIFHRRLIFLNDTKKVIIKRRNVCPKIAVKILAFFVYLAIYHFNFRPFPLIKSPENFASDRIFQILRFFDIGVIFH